MTTSNPTGAVGALNLADVRRSAAQQDYEVLVDAGQIARGLSDCWCRLKRLRSSEARYPVEVFLADGTGTGSFQEVEVRGVRLRHGAAR